MVVDAEVTETEEITFPRFKREHKHARSHTSTKPQTGLVFVWLPGNFLDNFTYKVVETKVQETKAEADDKVNGALYDRLPTKNGSPPPPK
jgi:hypothetical protein